MTKYFIALSLFFFSACGTDVVVIEAPPVETPAPELPGTDVPVDPSCNDQEVDYATCLINQYASDTPYERTKKCKKKKPKKECDEEKSDE